jgi:hypothetical protein
MAATTATAERSGTRVAFRIVAGILGVAGIVLSVPFAIISFVDEAEGIHRVHNLAGVALFGLLLGVALLACVRRPEDALAPFRVAAASGLAGGLAGLLSRDFVSGVWFTGPLGVLVLWALHPARREVVRPRGIDLATLALGVIAVVPAVTFALAQAELQRNGGPSDVHWEFHHYSGMAAAALALPLCAFAASVRGSGRRLAAWLVGLAGVLLGGASVVLSDHLGAFDTPPSTFPLWGWLAVAWGIGVIAIAEAEFRRTAPTR